MSSFNGYDCLCEQLSRESLAVLLGIVAGAGSDAWRVGPAANGNSTALRAAWSVKRGGIMERVRKEASFRKMVHEKTLLKSPRAIQQHVAWLVSDAGFEWLVLPKASAARRKQVGLNSIVKSKVNSSISSSALGPQQRQNSRPLFETAEVGREVAAG